MPPERTGPPIFVVGCARSGTTMLRLMLDSHPDLAIPGESHFIPGLWRNRERYSPSGVLDPVALAQAAVATPQFRRWGIDAEPILAFARARPEASFADVIAALFEGYAAQQDKSRWGDKTPQYVRSIGLLARLFPDARFIHIVRDGRDVALSFLSFGWGPSTIWHAALRWKRDVEAGRRQGSSIGAERYLEVRYESLVKETRESLRRIAGFAELPFDEHMVEHHRGTESRVQARLDRTRQHEAAMKPVTQGLRDWRHQMSEGDVLSFESVAGDALAAFGFARRFPTIPQSKRIEAAARVGLLEARLALGRRPGWLADIVRPKGVAGPSGDRSLEEDDLP